jgi:hypothetical protein
MGRMKQVYQQLMHHVKVERDHAFQPILQRGGMILWAYPINEGVVMMPETMTMAEYRERFGSECTIDNCETCREHAADNSIVIKEE